jgi:hypothetical protein
MFIALRFLLNDFAKIHKITRPQPQIEKNTPQKQSFAIPYNCLIPSNDGKTLSFRRLSAISTLVVVRLMSACCPLLKRTTSGHQADNKRTTTEDGLVMYWFSMGVFRAFSAF